MPKLISSHRTPAQMVPGFSLIELIIVILIASLFASLVFNNVNLNTKKEKKVGIMQLKEAVRNMGGREGELVCTDECAKCTFIGGSKPTAIKSQLTPLKAYILDDSNTPQELDLGRIQDKKVCLRFHYYANGSTSQMIIESNNKFYFIPSFFGKVEIFDDMDGATNRWVKYREIIDSAGAFY